MAALACFLLVYVAWGFHYDSNDDPIMEMIFRGVLFPAAQSREIGFAHVFTASALGWLYERIPHVPWYGVSMCLLSLAAVARILSVVDRCLGSARRLSSRVAVLALFFALFLAESVLLLNFTRVAILLAGASVLALHHAGKRPGPLAPSALGATLVLFALALVTRPEAAALGLVSTGTFVLLIARRGERRSLVTCGVVLVAMMGILEARTLTNPREGHFRVVYPFLVSIQDFGATRGPKLSAEDALRLKGISAWLFCDRDAANVGFLERVASGRYFTADKLRWDRVSERLGDVKRGLGPAAWLLVFANGCLLAFAVARSKGEGKDRVLRHAAAHLVFSVIIGLVAVFMQVIPRVLSPLVALYACASVATFAEFGPSLVEVGSSRLRFGVGLLLALAATGVAVPATAKLAATCAERQRTNEAILERLDHRLQGSTVILAQPALRLFRYLDPLKEVPVNSTNRYVILGGWPCLLSAFETDAEALAGSVRLPDLLLGLTRRNPVIVSEESYNDFLAQYLSRLHGLTLSFIPLSPWARFGAGAERRLRPYGFTASTPPATASGSLTDPRP